MTYELDTDPGRLQRDRIWAFLSTSAYWARWRTRADIDRQIDASWRVVGAYDASGIQVGFARALSDGVAFAYLADVYVDDAHRGAGLGTRIVSRMVDEGPGADFRWSLVTADAHGLYAKFGFHEPESTVLIRTAAEGRR